MEDIEKFEIQEAAPPPRRRWNSVPASRLLFPIAWVCIAALAVFYIVHIARIGLDLRNDFWAYWENNRFYPDINSALGHGLHALREAQDLEQEDPPSPSGATIANPGPGLFDSPRTLPAILQRWHRLKPVYAHIYRGWVQRYDHLQRDVSDGEYQMDYPPLRCMVMTLWAWKVQAEHPGIEQFPRGPEPLFDPATNKNHIITPDIARPLLLLNLFFESVSSITMFLLVLTWMRRGEKPITQITWRSRWGDPVLLAPAVCLIVFSLLRSHVGFHWSSLPHSTPSPIDDRITRPAWWIFLTLRFVSIVALAHFLPRPFRAFFCALVAATLVWLNPAMIMDSFGWPQWEAWLPPFFLVAALLVSLDCWFTAGLVLALGVMLKGQLLFICPVLILCPLFAGWFERFIRIVLGLTTGAGLVVWPWLVAAGPAHVYIAAALYAAALVCIVSIPRKRVALALRRSTNFITQRARARWRHQPFEPISPPIPKSQYFAACALLLSLSTAVWLSLLVMRNHPQDHSLRALAVLFTLLILTVPWFIPRRAIPLWFTFVFTASLWLAAASLNGSFSWWNVGFMYGTQKHQAMQLGQDSLSNLTSLLENRYHWDLHDPVGTLYLPFVSDGISLDIQSALLVVFGLTLVLCAAAAGTHLRRNDKKFLVALLAPWVLFVTLLTQMAARYLVLAAVISAALVAISTNVALLQLLITALACVMLGNQMLASFPNSAPLTYSITQPTFPDAGWLLLLVAALVLSIALTPTRRVHNAETSD